MWVFVYSWSLRVFFPLSFFLSFFIYLFFRFLLLLPFPPPPPPLSLLRFALLICCTQSYFFFFFFFFLFFSSLSSITIVLFIMYCSLLSPLSSSVLSSFYSSFSFLCIYVFISFVLSQVSFISFFYLVLLRLYHLVLSLSPPLVFTLHHILFCLFIFLYVFHFFIFIPLRMLFFFSFFSNLILIESHLAAIQFSLSLRFHLLFFALSVPSTVSVIIFSSPLPTLPFPSLFSLQLTTCLPVCQRSARMLTLFARVCSGVD